MTFFRKPKHKAQILLGAELILIASSIGWDHVSRIWLSFVFPAFFGVCASVMADQVRWLIPYLGIAIISLVTEQLPFHWSIAIIQIAAHSTAFLLLAREVLRHSFFKADIPYADRILAGISGYLLLGVFAFFVCSALSQLQPHAFLDQITNSAPKTPQLLYFSFVTLTTLGYGDIVPITQSAKIIVLLTTLSGVLYLAVFISALVSKKTLP